MRGEKIKFACKLFRTVHAQISGYPLEYPWEKLINLWDFYFLNQK